MSSEHEHDDQELIRRAKEDPAAFGRLYERYVDQVYAYLYRRTRDRQLSQDLTAATFESALDSIESFEWRGTSYLAWLYRIARNALISHQRRNKFRAPFELIEQWWQSDSNVEAEVTANDAHDELHAALERLSADDREVLMLRFYEDLSSREIGELLGYTENNVNVRMYRALKRLRRAMKHVQRAGVTNV